MSMNLNYHGATRACENNNIETTTNTGSRYPAQYCCCAALPLNQLSVNFLLILHNKNIPN